MRNVNQNSLLIARIAVIAVFAISAVVLAVWRPELALPGKGGASTGIRLWAVCGVAAAVYTVRVIAWPVDDQPFERAFVGRRFIETLAFVALMLGFLLYALIKG